MTAAGYTEFLSNLRELQTGDNGFDEDGKAVIELLAARFKDELFSPKALQKMLVEEGQMRRTGNGYDGLLNYATDRLVQSAVSGTLTTQAVGLWMKEYVDVKFAGCPKYLQKMKQPEGNRYQIREVIPQSTLS